MFQWFFKIPSLATGCRPRGEKAQLGLPSLNQPFVEGSIQTRVGPVPWISSTLALADRWGTIKARWGVGRMHYIIEPGLYALGSPDKQAPVLVTANYKMSFDRLREALPDRHAWILVLDTIRYKCVVCSRERDIRHRGAGPAY